MTLDKKTLRLEWLKRRQAISPERRLEASEALSKTTFPQGMIASFASFRDEINTLPLNTCLAQKKSLALPKVEGHELIFYIVDHLEKQLALSPQELPEPIPSLCAPAQTLNVILVPGLAFDLEHHRLGYGKGHYDRYLKEHSTLSIGIGFKEQLTQRLPYKPHDITLHKLLLF